MSSIADIDVCHLDKQEFGGRRLHCIAFRARQFTCPSNQTVDSNEQLMTGRTRDGKKLIG